MLERIANTMSNFYHSLPKRALALGAAATFFLMTQPGCAIVEWPFRGQPDRKAEQKIFLEHVDKETIDKVADYMIEDFGTVGELTGRAKIRDGKLRFEEWTNHKDDEIKDIEDLKKGKCDKDTLEDMKDLIESDYKSRKEDYPDYDFLRHKFALSVLDKIIGGKDTEIKRDYLADMLEDILDGSAKPSWTPYIVQGLPRFAWHIHPCGGSAFSKQDHRNERFEKTTEIVFCYEGEGKLTVIYSVGEFETETKKFKIKDPEKVFMLDILTAMNLAREDFTFVFSEQAEVAPGVKINTISIRKSQVMGQVLDFLDSHPDKVHRAEYKNAANYVASKIVARIEYLDGTMKRTGKNLIADRAEDEVSYYVRAALDIRNPEAVNVEHWKRIYELARGNKYVSRTNRAVLGYLAAGKEIPAEVAKARSLRTIDDIRRVARKDGLMVDRGDIEDLTIQIRREATERKYGVTPPKPAGQPAKPGEQGLPEDEIPYTALVILAIVGTGLVAVTGLRVYSAYRTLKGNGQSGGNP